MLNISPVLLILGYVATQKIGDKHIFRNSVGHLKEIPKRFEVRSGNAKDIFKKYINDIEELAAKHNITVIYKVKIEMQTPFRKTVLKNRPLKKNKSKKYNIPLKKQSMKLSNFEVLLRKLAEENGVNSQKLETYRRTTEKIAISSTRQVQMKYKPIVGAVRTNYTKVIKPVKNRIITLTS